MVVVAVPMNTNGPPHPIEDASSNRKTVQVLIQNGRPTLTLNVELDEPSKNMVETYASSSKWNYADFYFSYQNKIILPDRTLRSSGICKGCIIDLNTRARGGSLSFIDYVELHKDSFKEMAKLPDGNVSLKVPIGGCQFLSSLFSCFLTTWSENMSWNGQIEWNVHFRVIDGIVQIGRRPTIRLCCIDIDIHPLVEFLDYAFTSNDIKLYNRRPPYFDHLIHYLRQMKSGVLNSVNKLTIASHVSYMLPHQRLMLYISLRRKYKGLSEDEKEKWNIAIQKVPLTVVRADDLLELPVFNDVKAAAEKRGESYPKELKQNTSFRVSRDYAVHSLEHRWAGDPNAAPRDKNKQIEVFKDDDGVELMLPFHMHNFLAGLVEQLISANIDIHRELSSAVVHCTKCPLEPTHQVVAEPIGDDYIPTWMHGLSKGQISKLRRSIGANPPRPGNWTTNSTATGECSNSASMVNQQPNPWNAGKAHSALFPGAKVDPSSMPSSIGANPPRPGNWTTNPTATDSASMVNQQPNPWNAGKAHSALFPGAKVDPSSMPSGSSTGGVQAEQSNPLASVSSQTTEVRSKATLANWKRRQQRKAKKVAGEK